MNFFPTMANFECATSAISETDNIALDFGFDFANKGNFTFTLQLAVRIVYIRLYRIEKALNCLERGVIIVNSLFSFLSPFFNAFLRLIEEYIISLCPNPHPTSDQEL